jgi:hypothetical protein
MHEENGGRLTFYQDLEKAKSVREFVEQVWSKVDSSLGKATRGRLHAGRVLEKLGGSKVGNVISLPEDLQIHNWKGILGELFNDLASGATSPVIFFWDELPLMLKEIRNREGDQVAIDLLDTLRAIRQEIPAIRMVYTGSVGLHHVFSDLKNSGHTNPATNDMEPLTVPPLAFEDAIDLVRQLFEGESITVVEADVLSAARTIAESVDRIPFYIHQIASKFSGKRITAGAIEDTIQRAFVEANDPWQLRHYDQRIDWYYSKPHVPVVRAILDVVASEDETIPFSKLSNLTKSKIEIHKEDDLRNIIELLGRDFYIVKETNGEYRFTFDLIKRWWRIHRCL